MTFQEPFEMKIVRARTRMVLYLPFIASSVMMLELVESSTTERAKTDGNSIFYNRKFFESLSIGQMMWVLAHEALHCVLLHHVRTGGRIFIWWNIACDYVIDLILDEISEFERIPDVYYDQKFRNLSAEEIYNIIVQYDDNTKNKLRDNHVDIGEFIPAGSDSQDTEDTKNGNSTNIDDSNKESDANGKSDKKSLSKTGSKGSKTKSDKNGDKGVSSDKSKSDVGVIADKSNRGGTDKASQEEKWTIFVKQAIDVSKKLESFGEGSGSATLERFVKEVVEPTVDWRNQLFIFVDKTAKDEYDWNRPNRRYISRGLYLPSLYNEELGPIIVVVDVSSSIQAYDLAAFSSEITAIKNAYDCEVIVLYCDTKVKKDKVQRFEKYEDVQIFPYGGGGTDFRPPFKFIEENLFDVEVRCLIYFTDGICQSYPTVVPDYPVLWVGKRSFSPPFGEYIMMT